MFNRRRRSARPLVQYWDSPTPPTEVLCLMDGWRADQSFAYQRFDRDSARDLIQRSFGAPTLEAFDACGVPAMQADFFRYAALHVLGGVYVDADIRTLGGLGDKLDAAERGTLMLRQERVANDLMHVAAPGDPLMAYALSRATENVLNQTSQNVWEVTGPGILTALFHEEGAERDRLFAGFAIEPVSSFFDVVRFEWELEYKKGEADWRNVEGRSIFR